MRIIITFIMILAVAAAGPALANCMSPVKPAGHILFNFDHSVLQYCNGTNWIGFPTLGAPTPLFDWAALNEVKLTASDGAASDEFGFMLTVSGDVAAIGSWRDDDLGSASGSVYVFERSGGIWSEAAKLQASDGAADDRFGYSVALSGTTLLVVSWRDDDKGSNSGSAYIFERSGGVWNEVAKLTASDGASNDEFGSSAALSGDVAVFGARFDDDNGAESGSAYVFERSGGVWSEVAKLTASDGGAADEFGYSISVSGDVAVIGSLYDDDKGADSGAAYVFERSGGVWSEVAKLTASDGAAGDEFGMSVSVSGDTAVVGARGGFGNIGAAYVYERSGGVWSESAKLTPSDGADSDGFGFTTAIVGDIVVIGANGDDDNGSGSGSVYVFQRSGGVWNEINKVTASDGAAGDSFGFSVALSEDAALVGSWQDDDLGSNSGAAYLFEAATIPQAFGDCAGPAGSPGTIRYNGDHRVMQWCDGYRWMGMGPIDPPGPNDGCENPTHPAGMMIFNQDLCVLQYCDGDNWRGVGRKDVGACNP